MNGATSKPMLIKKIAEKMVCLRVCVCVKCNITYQNRYGFSRSILMPLTGSRRNQQWNVQPFWYGQRASGGNAIAYVTHTLGTCFMATMIHHPIYLMLLSFFH